MGETEKGDIQIQKSFRATTKGELVGKRRPPNWRPPSIFRPSEARTELEAIEAEAEFKALQRHTLEAVEPKAGAHR